MTNIKLKDELLKSDSAGDSTDPSLPPVRGSGTTTIPTHSDISVNMTIYICENVVMLQRLYAINLTLKFIF